MILTSVRTLRPCCSCSNLAGSTLRLLHTFQPRYVRCEKTSCPRSCFAGYTPISHCTLRPHCACYGLTADAPTSLYTLRPRFACSEKSLKSIDPPPSLAGIYTRQIQIQGTYILVMLAKQISLIFCLHETGGWEWGVKIRIVFNTPKNE